MFVLGHEINWSLEESKAIPADVDAGKGSGAKRADIKTAQTATRFKSAQRSHARQAGKLVDREIKELTNHLINQIEQFRQGELSFNRLERRTSIAFKATLERIFKLGMKSVGLVRPTGSLYALTAAEQKWLKSYLDEELGYFRKFLQQIRRGRTSKEIERRTNAYAEAMRSIFEAGRVLSVGPNVLIYWVLESRDPCPDCRLIAKHNPYTPDTLPTTPKGGQTRCRANCYCTLRITTAPPKEVARIRKLRKSKEWLLRRIKDQQKTKR